MEMLLIIKLRDLCRNFRFCVYDLPSSTKINSPDSCTMPDYNLSFSSSSSRETGSYKLLQLTPDLNSLIENALDNGEALR